MCFENKFNFNILTDPYHPVIENIVVDVTLDHDQEILDHALAIPTAQVDTTG